MMGQKIPVLNKDKPVPDNPGRLSILNKDEPVPDDPGRLPLTLDQYGKVQDAYFHYLTRLKNINMSVQESFRVLNETANDVF